MKFRNVATLVLISTVISFASVLGDLAASVPERTFVKIPDNTSLLGLNMVYSLFYYNDSGCWDPVHKKILWIGAGGTCCTDGQFYHLTYTESTDGWEIEKAPWMGSGHGFDCNTMDPATGDHYFQRFRSKTIMKVRDGNYTTLPDIPYSEVATQGIAWFPELNGGKGGLVHVGGSYRLSWFDGTQWHVLPRPPVNWGTFATFAEYSPVHKVVLLGGGQDGSVVTYTLDAQLNLTRMPDAPYNVRPNQTLCAADPVTGNFVVTQISSLTWHELDPVAKKWTLLNLSNKPAKPAFQVPIPEYGIILFISRPSAANREIYLYRHAARSSVQAAAPNLQAPFRIAASPNPFKSRTTITIGKELQVTSYKLSIFDINGRQLETCNLKLATRNSFSWDASDLSGGVYIVKVEAGKEQAAKRLYLMK